MRTFSSFETFKQSTGSLANSCKTWDSFAWEAAVSSPLTVYSRTFSKHSKSWGTCSRLALEFLKLTPTVTNYALAGNIPDLAESVSHSSHNLASNIDICSSILPIFCPGINFS
jgi:hypothetical protein